MCTGSAGDADFAALFARPESGRAVRVLLTAAAAEELAAELCAAARLIRAMPLTPLP